jgi:hypothetical protein
MDELNGTEIKDRIISLTRERGMGFWLKPSIERFGNLSKEKNDYLIRLKTQGNQVLRDLGDIIGYAGQDLIILIRDIGPKIFVWYSRSLGDPDDGPRTSLNELSEEGINELEKLVKKTEYLSMDDIEDCITGPYHPPLRISQKLHETMHNISKYPKIAYMEHTHRPDDVFANCIPGVSCEICMGDGGDFNGRDIKPNNRYLLDCGSHLAEARGWEIWDSILRYNSIYPADDAQDESDKFIFSKKNQIEQLRLF